MPYPTDSEVYAYLSAAGFPVGGDTSDVARVRSGAISAFERGTGFSPFIATANTVVYDGDWVASLVLPLRVFEFDTAVVLIDDAAQNRNVGYRWNQTRDPRWSLDVLVGGTTLKVTAKAGGALELSDEAFEAILGYCVVLYAEANPEHHANLISQKVGDVTASRSSDEGSAIEVLRKRFAKAVRDNRRGGVLC
jgi:hypothetical protein